jgi:hypothetical protein
MLVEGGYLHSMKRLIEKAEQQQRSYPPGMPPKRSSPSLVRRSLARLARLLKPKRMS